MESDEAYPPALFFHQGTIEQGAEFFDEFWPEARAVSDRKLFFYDAFQLKAGSLRQIFGPGVWLKAIQASKRGHSMGRPIGNTFLMPGIFVARGAEILWKWRFKNIGDHPNFAEIPKLASL